MGRMRAAQDGRGAAVPGLHNRKKARFYTSGLLVAMGSSATMLKWATMCPVQSEVFFLGEKEQCAY
jgi:hypothetical protein